MADLLTRQMSIPKFFEDTSRWLAGPEWLYLPSPEWPKGNLGAVPASHTDVLCSSLLIESSRSVIEFDKFSSYHQLFNTLFKVFLAIDKFRKIPINEKSLKIKTSSLSN